MSHDHNHKSASAQEQVHVLNVGDVIRFDYALRVDGKIVETSLEAEAKAAGFHNPQYRYKPLTIMVGAKQIMPALEEHLRASGVVGETFTADLQPSQHYGERKKENVLTIPSAQFKTQKVKPEAGMTINIDGVQGIVTKVGGGRVTVDKNHKYAGKVMQYELTVVARITGLEQKLAAIFSDVGDGPRAAKITVNELAEGPFITVDLPEHMNFNPQWPRIKMRFVNDIHMTTGGKATVRFTETYAPLPPPKPVEPEVPRITIEKEPNVPVTPEPSQAV